ncbi:uncharacterized protein B0H18DRAFT_871037 [Fomitopsis serialis]|uniref:uncharacterized protein n=1 Tax=Fomitopsis serialis TaxID=139415 RepID=UPI002008AC25|nr:uncharacterized protein B0H18DRAFT_871037 [Neoantrodia serialis]KAH9932911.1 hypothetical protein B0H18DRAFT_871037 [Neoantrodia serialis]
MASSPAGSASGRDTRTQLFVGNLPYRVRWQDLKDLFRRAGTVLRADVALGPDNRSRGHGTVLLASQEDAERAIGMFQGWCWQGRVLEVRKDRVITGEEGLRLEFNSGSGLGEWPCSTRGRSVLNFVMPASTSLPYNRDCIDCRGRRSASAAAECGSLPFHIQWQDLKDLFRQAGGVTRADVALGADGRSRGFGTVSFSNEQDAERAVRMFNGYVACICLRASCGHSVASVLMFRGEGTSTTGVRESAL